MKSAPTRAFLNGHLTGPIRAVSPQNRWLISPGREPSWRGMGDREGHPGSRGLQGPPSLSSIRRAGQSQELPAPGNPAPILHHPTLLGPACCLSVIPSLNL